jgi:hypothetical protein
MYVILFTIHVTGHLQVTTIEAVFLFLKFVCMFDTRTTLASQ